MKRFLFIPVLLLILTSCKEKVDIIDFGAKQPDTAFVAAVETQQLRKVLFEEFTGVSCPNCPNGQKEISSYEDQNPGRIVVVGIQIKNNAQTVPYDNNGVKTINDNRTQAGTDLCNGIYGTNNSLPSAFIDRTSKSGSILLGKTDWASVVNARVSTPAKANISVTSNYNAADRRATVKVHVAYTSPVSLNQSLTVVLIENNIIDAQELPFGDTAPAAQNYIHHHVLRDILTQPTGSGILTDLAVKDAGQVYERTFTYALPPTVLNPDNCVFVAFVSDNSGTDREVVQAAEVNLK